MNRTWSWPASRHFFFLITRKSISLGVRAGVRKRAVESTWLSQKSKTHKQTHIFTVPLQLSVISPCQHDESNCMDSMRHIPEGKKKIWKWLPLASEMKLAGTSDHSQYVFVVSSMSECGPCVYLWLWKWICSCFCDHTQSVHNQCSTDTEWPYFCLKRPSTNKTAQTQTQQHIFIPQHQIMMLCKFSGISRTTGVTGNCNKKQHLLQKTMSHTMGMSCPFNHSVLLLMQT